MALDPSDVHAFVIIACPNIQHIRCQTSCCSVGTHDEIRAGWNHACMGIDRSNDDPMHPYIDTTGIDGFLLFSPLCVVNCRRGNYEQEMGLINILYSCKGSLDFLGKKKDVFPRWAQASGLCCLSCS